MRPHLRRLALPLLVFAVACGGDEQEEVASPNPPVAIWRPDSTRAPAGAGDTVPGFPAGGIAGDTASEGQMAPGSGGSAPSAGSEATPDGPAEPAATGGSGGQSTAGASGTPSADVASAEAILVRAERAYDAVRTLRADFLQDLAVPLLESTQRSRGEIFHRKPDRFLMRFSDPAGDIVVADGQYLWLYYPSNDPRQVMRTSMGHAGRIDLQREFLSNPTERFDATLVGSEVIAGRPAKVLDLVPRTPSPYRQVRIWIDDQDALARRFRITENNDAVRTVELRNLQVNTSLPADLFSFTPPAGAEIFEQ